ncbi:response regulator [Fervidicella metallireducens]|uniref:response regulator n=1 Tax=Fervidicella metallireducens TaxID=655338 RepID=UPI001FA79B06|nr:response regulator [Fervidicella metallireducens]
MLIADDEYLVLESLKMIITKNIEDVSIVATANNGREAIEKTLSMKPDVVFMDIHMPGIDGIEAIKQIKTSNNDVLFVILTAYEYFDYAKEALNLGVFEYLLKPINKNKLLDTLGNIKRVLYNKRNSFIQEVELKERINKMIPFLESKFISHKLFNIGTVNETHFYEDIFNLELKEGYVINILLENENIKNKEISLKQHQNIQNFYDLVSIKLKGLTPCLIGEILLNRITVFVPTNFKEDKHMVRTKSTGICKKLVEKLDGLTNLNYKIGIGRQYSIDNFSKSYNEAYVAVNAHNEAIVVHFEDIINKISSSDFNIASLENSLLNSIIAGDFSYAKDIFKEMYLGLTLKYNEDLDRIKIKIIELIFSIERGIPYKIDYITELKKSLMLNVLKTDSKEDLNIQFLQYLTELAYEINNQRKGNFEGIIPKVLEFINNNYDKDISLQDTAKNVNLSYHYLSKIFKEEIGKSFIDYLTELRIEKSMKLLINQNLSIKEICQSIGYNDPNYYCKAFKRVTGMTPTEYRLLKNNRSGNIG